MEILKNHVLMFLFLYLTNALQPNKQNQTTLLIESRNISEVDNFIEDGLEVKISSNNKYEDLNTKNSTLQRINLWKKSNCSKNTLNALPEHGFSKSIHLPIDLLLKHPKINTSRYSSSDVFGSTPNTKETVVTYLKPKIDFSEENIDVIDNSIADFYNTIKTKKPKDTPEKLEDSKLVDDYENPEHLDILPRTDSNYFKIDYPQNSNETLRRNINTKDTTIEILIKLDPSTSNDVSRPNSSIVIHNSNYQEVIQPRLLNNPIPPNSYPFHWSHGPYSNRQYYPSNCYKWPYYERPQCVCGRCHPFEIHSQYPGYVSSTNAVWRTWNNMDISMINPKDVQLNYDGSSDHSDLNRMPDSVFDSKEIQDEYVV